MIYLLAAYVVLFFVFQLAPILVVVVVSFANQGYIGFPIAGWSLRWFIRILNYPPFLMGLWVSIEVALLSTVFACVLGIPAALTLARSKGKIAAAASIFLVSPMSLPLIVLGFALLFYLSALGIGVSLAALLISHTVVGIPYIFRTVIGVYRAQPSNFEEAAAVLGANRWQIFSRVTLPLIRPGVMSGALFAFLISLDNLAISFFFGSPSTNTLPVVMLSYVQNQFDPSIAAISTVQMVLALIVLVVVERRYGLRYVGASA